MLLELRVPTGLVMRGRWADRADVPWDLQVQARGWRCSHRAWTAEVLVHHASVEVLLIVGLRVILYGPTLSLVLAHLHLVGWRRPRGSCHPLWTAYVAAQNLSDWDLLVAALCVWIVGGRAAVERNP